MKKVVQSLCALCMALALVLIPVSTLDAFAQSTEAELEEKVLCTATIDDEFTDDKVAVVIKNEHSLKFKKYKTSDFASVGCIAVRDLSTAAAEDIREHEGHTCEVVAKQAKDYHQILCLELKDRGKENVLAAIKELEKRDDILSAEPNYILSSFESEMTENNKQETDTNRAIVNPPVFTVPKPTTIPNDTGRSQQWAIDKINLPQAWNFTTGSSNVVVGVIDSGVDYTHPDLQGKIDTSLSYDFVNNTSALPNPSTLFWHGTFVAGILAAQTDNWEGIAGAGWDIKIASLRVIDETNFAKWDDVAAAINKAQDKEIPIINLSLGGSSTTSGLLAAICNYTGVMVCAAGNNYNNNDSEDMHYPSNYNYRNNLISVGASDQNDECYYYNADIGSNYGKTKVDLFAPGVDIYSTMINGYKMKDYIATYYDTFWGTSFATPYVTGVAALLLSKYPSLTAAEIKDAIVNSVDKVSALSNYCKSGGRLNAFNALNSLHTGHQYGQCYSYVSQTQHASFCACLEVYNLEPHWAYNSSIRMYNGHRYAMCACCKTEINIDDNPIVVINDNNSVGLDLMGLKVIESPEQLTSALSQSSRMTSSIQTAAVLSYYDEEFFETYSIVMANDFDIASVVESLYANIIDCSKRIDKVENLWYNIDNDYSEAAT